MAVEAYKYRDVPYQRSGCLFVCGLCGVRGILICCISNKRPGLLFRKVFPYIHHGDVPP